MRGDKLYQSQLLARAFRQQEAAERAMERARAEVEAAFMPWAAGRRISREAAKASLKSVGML